MPRSAFVVPVAVLVLSLALWAALPGGGAERRIDGTVLDAQATYCEPTKEGGCTGTLVLDTGRAHDSSVTVKVPLGTPISNGCEILAFGDLEGRRVTVTEVDGSTGPVALAVSTPAATVTRGDSACP